MNILPIDMLHCMDTIHLPTIHVCLSEYIIHLGAPAEDSLQLDPEAAKGHWTGIQQGPPDHAGIPLQCGMSKLTSCKHAVNRTLQCKPRYATATHRKERKYKISDVRSSSMLSLKLSVHSFLERFGLICSVCPSYRRKQATP